MAPFDVDESDQTGVDGIQFGERCVDGAVDLGREDIVVRTEHPRLAPGHGRVDPRASIGAIGIEAGVEELGLVGAGITADGRHHRRLKSRPPLGGAARQGPGEARSSRVGIGIGERGGERLLDQVVGGVGVERVRECVEMRQLRGECLGAATVWRPWRGASRGPAPRGVTRGWRRCGTAGP
jgi:hypothetical protein